MCDVPTTSCLCSAPPSVDVETKKKLCTATTPILREFCAPTQSPKECENMGQVFCMGTHDAKELYNYMKRISETTGDCRAPCNCNFWK